MLHKPGDSFLSRIKSEDLTFDEFLNAENLFDYIKRNHKEVTAYAVDNIDKVLDYAIFKIDPQTSLPTVLSQRSYKLISLSNPTIICAVSDGNEIIAIARRIIHEYTEQNNSDSNINWICAISRFSTIIETCLNKYPDSISNFYFLPKFLRFCGNPVLVSLFERIISSNLEDTKLFLRMIKFQDKLMDFITQWHNADSTDVISQTPLDCVLSMYSLLIKYLDKLVDDETTLSPRTIQFALDFLPTYDRRILAKQWKLAKTVLDTSNSKDFASLFDAAFDAINQEASVNVDLDLYIEMSHLHSKNVMFQEYQANAIEFLSALFLYNPTIATEIDIKSLILKIIEIFKSNPFNSIALSATCSFLLVVIDIHEYQNLIIDSFLPCLVDAFNEDQESPDFREKSAVCRAFSYEFCRELLSMCSIDDDLNTFLMDQKDFVSICLPKVKSMEETMSTQYGGPCIIPANLKQYILPSPLRPVVI